MSLRSGKKWTITETLRLQREYELLENTVYEIAQKHQRTVEAILFRLESEGFISDWASARGYSISAVVASEIEKQKKKIVNSCYYTRSHSLRNAKPLTNPR